MQPVAPDPANRWLWAGLAVAALGAVESSLKRPLFGRNINREITIAAAVLIGVFFMTRQNGGA